MSEWPTALRVNAFVRHVENHGGQAMILARGDGESGMILLLTIDRDRIPRLFERERTLEGTAKMVRRKPDLVVESDLTDYWQRRRRTDPDLWVVEAIVAGGERLAAETLWVD
jgi:hypothetical protein